MLSELGLFGINVVLISKMSSFDGFLGFRKFFFCFFFVVLKGPSVSFVLLVNLGNDILIDLNLSFCLQMEWVTRCKRKTPLCVCSFMVKVHPNAVFVFLY